MPPLWDRFKQSKVAPGEPEIVVNPFDDPKARFEATKRACATILDVHASNHDYAVLAKDLKDLNAVFVTENRSGSADNPVCVSFFLHQLCLPALCEDIRSYPNHILTQIFTLIGSLLDHDSLSSVSKLLATGMTQFLQGMLAYKRTFDRQLEEQFGQLLFIISSKLKASPDMLGLWFETGRPSTFYQDQFPLFFLLLDYVFHDGAVGEYVRTGILYLIDAVSVNSEIETWVLGSDLCTLLTSGLGAFYSQLTRSFSRLSAIRPQEPSLVALIKNDVWSVVPSREASPTRSRQGSVTDGRFLRSNLSNFVLYLLFWDDMIRYCQSEKLKRALLAHFDYLFVRQVLYPSIAQSTDNQGSYSVSHLALLRLVLEQFDHNELSQTIVCYFLGITLPDTSEYLHRTEGERDSAVDTSVQFLSSTLSGTPLLTLTDILIQCLESKNPDTLVVSLQLTSTLVRKHYPYLVGRLITTRTSRGLYNNRLAHGLVTQQLKVLRNISVDLRCSDLATSFYEVDMEARVLAFPFSLPDTKQYLLPEEIERRKVDKALLSNAKVSVEPNAACSSDLLLKGLYGLLERFYANSVEVNLALTGLLVDLGATGALSLQGWLLADVNNVPGDMEKRQSISDKEITELSPVIRLLQELCNQYQHYSVTIENFDDGIKEFEGNVQVSEDLGDAIVTGGDDMIPNQLSTGARYDSVRQEANDSGSEDEATYDLLLSPRRRSHRDNRSSPVVTDELGTTPRRVHTKRSTRFREASMRLFSRAPAQQSAPEEEESVTPLQQVPSHVSLFSPSQGTVVPTLQLFGNVFILREFIKELEALVRVRSWLVDYV